MASSVSISQAILYCVVLCVCTRVRDTRSQSCSAMNCAPPLCRCPSVHAPSTLAPGDVPQLVVISFDGPVTSQYEGFYQRLFPDDLVNPNNCTVGVTFFVSDVGENGRIRTDYASVQTLYRRGYEIGVNSVSMRRPEMYWNDASSADYADEMDGQRERLIHRARIPATQINGMRVPYLQPGGNNQIRMMTKYDFVYDSSYVTGPMSESGTEHQPAVFPYTMDVPPENYLCDIFPSNCPTESFPGIWEFPLNRMYSTRGAPCAVADDCETESADDTFRYLMNNFLRHLNGERAPLGLFMRPSWFEKKPYTLSGVENFLRNITARNDVWLVTMTQAIEWMISPKGVRQLSTETMNCSIHAPLTEERLFNNGASHPPQTQTTTAPTSSRATTSPNGGQRAGYDPSHGEKKQLGAKGKAMSLNVHILSLSTFLPFFVQIFIHLFKLR